MGSEVTAQQVTAWIIVITVVVIVAQGRFRLDLVAVLGVMAVGILGIAPPALLLSGFGDPALFTIASILLMSEAITESRLFSGMGQALEKRIRNREGRILGLTASAAALSAFMNNLGALSLTLPTAQRMALRAGVSPGAYTMPMALASILGGTITLAGSAPNIIVSSYRTQSLGEPYRMFDFAPHGVAMLLTALILWGVCRACGYHPGSDARSGYPVPATEDVPPDRFPRDILSTTKKRVTLLTTLITLLLVSLGILPPAIAFGTAAVVLIATGVLSPAVAYSRLDFSILVFLGAMLGLARVLSHTGALGLVTGVIMPVIGTLPAILVVGAVFALSVLLGSLLNNAAAAAIMAPLALEIGGNVPLDALLMAVAAGACLSIILPTHQATLMAMSKGWFSPSTFSRTGTILALACAVVGPLVIVAVWG